MSEKQLKVRWSGVVWKAFIALCLHPKLWPISLRLVMRFAARSWWKRPPFLPLPGESYWRFRMVTAYGTPNSCPSSDDIYAFVAWARSERRSRLPHSL